MPKGKEKVKATGSSKSVDLDQNTIQISNQNDEKLYYLQRLRDEQIERYNRFVNKQFAIRVEESFKPKNLAKILLLSFASVSNVLLVNESLVLTYIFASITCVAPAIYDFKKNYKLLSENILQKDRDINFKNKLERAARLSLPGSVGLLVGIIFIAIHISRGEASISSDVLLGLGTFIAGGSQMLVNPLIRKEVARINLNKLQNKNINDPEVLQLIEKGANFEQVADKGKEQIRDGNVQREANLQEYTKLLTHASDLRARIQKEGKVSAESREHELTTLATVIEIKNLQNEELRTDKEGAEQAIRELTVKTEHEKMQLKGNFEKTISEQDSTIQKLERKIKTLEKNQPEYDPEQAQASSSHISRLKKENRGVSRGK